MHNPRKLILQNQLAPGDVLMLTAAVRDLYQAHSERFLIDVRTPYPQLWENNPYLTPLSASEPDVSILNCRYPLIRVANDLPHHFLEAFGHFLSDRLEVDVKLTQFRGDIHLSREEWKAAPHPDIVNPQLPFWLIVAGGKGDIPIKWWSSNRFQTVVDHFKGRIQFVQVGSANDFHPVLSGVINFVGKTSLRELIQLVHHSRGILCPVTFLMHLAAAVPSRLPKPGHRPCVVVAGGREPPHWETYPGHQFIHTVGMLPCCATGGCWNTHVTGGPLAKHAKADRLCIYPAPNGLPHCMDLISAESVIQRIEGYFRGGQCEYL